MFKKIGVFVSVLSMVTGIVTGVAFAGTEDDPPVKEKKVVNKTANGKLQVVCRDGKKALVPVKTKTVKNKD